MTSHNKFTNPTCPHCLEPWQPRDTITANPTTGQLEHLHCRKQPPPQGQGRYRTTNLTPDQRPPNRDFRLTFDSEPQEAKRKGVPVFFGPMGAATPPRSRL
jgi:hypothetical protein